MGVNVSSGNITARPRQPLIDAHRADIEGLRAVAVGSVLLYHAGLDAFAGGYVGVDVFFALSGYLMTALLVTERWSSGTISLREFYARRARRLLPASVLVLVATTAGAWFVLPPRAFDRAATDLMAAGAYIVNLRFAGEATDYLGDDIGASPVLHYWSLAVEEQFYVLWPVLLILALGKRARRRRPVVVLGTISAASFLLSLAWTARVQPWAFFTLPTRAWEFGLGGIAAFASFPPDRAKGVWLALVGWSGLALVIGSVLVFDATTPFPGPSAAVPVIGTVAVLVSGRQRHGPGRLLSIRPLQWVGRRSYGIYLWHWPPLVLVPAALGRDLHVVENLAIVAAAVPVASLTMRLVENPLRFSRWFAEAPRRSGALGLGLTSLAIIVPWWGAANLDTSGSGMADAIARGAVEDPDGPVPVPSGLRPSLAEVGSDKPGDLYEVGCHRDQLATAPKLPCTYGAADAERTIVLFGDSHMAQWFPAYDVLGRTLGARVISLTKSSCPSVGVPIYNVGFARPYEECDQWRKATLDVIDDIQPDVVVMANYPWSTSGFPDDEPSRFAAAWLDAMRRTITTLRATGAEVVIMAPTPLPTFDVADCVSGELGDSRPCDLTRLLAAPPTRIGDEVRVAEGAGAQYIDTTDWFCGHTVCPSVRGQFLVYRDASHVATPYMRWLADSLVEVWRQGELLAPP